MSENITKAQLTANMLVSDIKQAWHEAMVTQLSADDSPIPASHAEKALRAYLADCLQTAHALESKLANL